MTKVAAVRRKEAPVGQVMQIVVPAGAARVAAVIAAVAAALPVIKVA